MLGNIVYPEKHMLVNKSFRALFVLGMCLKVVCGTMFASYFLTGNFIPFVEQYIGSGFDNPYRHFLNINKAEIFPYPALMLYILSIPNLLLGWLHYCIDSPFLTLFLYRLPLLVADVIVCIILLKWLRGAPIKLLSFYWLSPVLVYITYLHGQLDVIPISLLFLSLHFLFKERSFLAALFLGFAISTKTHVALTVPFFCLYLYTQNLKYRDLLYFLCIIIGVFIICNLPYLSDPAFLQMVFHNKEQDKIFIASFSYAEERTLYLILAGYLLLFFKGGLLRVYNQDIFIMFLGFAFGILLFFIPPMQGWYYWFIPFLTYFCTQEKGRAYLLFIGLQGIYLLYFLVTKQSDYLEIFHVISPEVAAYDNLYYKLQQYGWDSRRITNVVFTTLQTVLLMNCLWIYYRGLGSYTKHKITSEPYLIGIGGDSGVGKTTLSHAIQNIFSLKNVNIMCGDAMHKWERGHKKWQEFTHLDPRANHLHNEIYYLQQLRQNKKVKRRCYNHNTGKFTLEHDIIPRKLILFEGLHPFYISRLRNLFDLKIFIKPQEELAHHWKILRDRKKRGYSKDKTLTQIIKRQPDSEKYIKTQADYSDILIEIPVRNNIEDIGSGSEDIDIYYRVRFPNSVLLEPITYALQSVPTLMINHYYGDQDVQFLELDGNIRPIELARIAEELIPGLQNIGANVPIWPSDNFGALTLLITYYIFEDADNAV